MRSRSLRSLYVLIAFIAFAAAGCGGIPLPDKADAYKSWVERGEKVDVIHSIFAIHFEKKDGFGQAELEGLIDKCSADGSCGAMARLAVDDSFTDQIYSCNCSFKYDKIEIVNDGDHEVPMHKLDAFCEVPVSHGTLDFENLDFKLVITSVGPDSPTSDEIAFNSSPKFEIVREMNFMKKSFALGVKHIPGFNFTL